MRTLKYKLLGKKKYLRVVSQVDLSRNVVNGADPLQEENVVIVKNGNYFSIKKTKTKQTNNRSIHGKQSRTSSYSFLLSA